MSHPIPTREYGVDELPDFDADGVLIEIIDVCMVCDGDGYYYSDEMVNGTPEWVKHKCLCRVIEEIDADTNQRVKEEKENE